MRVFVAGATGATGVVFVPLATERGHELRLHVRPQTAGRHAFGTDPRGHICDLSDADALAAAVRGCDAVVSLVGTMQSRFASGDTYESADIGSTRQLAEAAKREAIPRFLLLSSFGAGGMGAYLKMKGECERIVRETPGLSWTIFRPAALVSPEGTSDATHGKREVPGVFQALGRGLRGVPGLRAFADDWRPIPLLVLATAMVTVLDQPRDQAVLAGRDLWPLGDV